MVENTLVYFEPEKIQKKLETWNYGQNILYTILEKNVFFGAYYIQYVYIYMCVIIYMCV